MKITKSLLALALSAMIFGCGLKISPIAPTPNISTNSQQVAATQAATQVETVAKTVEQKAVEIKTEAAAAAIAPTTMAAKPHLLLISNDADALRVVSASLDHTVASLRQLQADMANTQKQIDQLRADFTTAQKSVATAREAQAEAEKQTAKWKAEYDNSWLGGKSHRLILWIAGVVTTLIIVDTLLWFFTSSATLNPLTLIVFAVKGIITLIGGLFAKKSVLGGLPK
jgi:hypothetical protein